MNVTAISADDRHSLALIENGTVVAWENNVSGSTVGKMRDGSASGDLRGVGCKEVPRLMWGGDKDE